MNDLVVYFSDKRELLISYVVVAAAAIFITIIGELIRFLINSRKKRLASLAKRAVDETEKENFFLKTVENNGEYYAVLLSGDETLVKSAAYSSIAGVKSALKSLKNNILSDNFTIYSTGEGFCVRLYSSVKLVYESEEFATKEEAEEEMRLIKKAAEFAAE